MKQFNDIDNIEYPIDITEQYFRDAAKYAHLVRLKADQQNVLVERARHGDEAAGEQIILACLAFITYTASRYYATLETKRDELLDLIAVGHVAVVESLDKAIALENCFGYLFTRIKSAIHDHCYSRSNLIVKREWYSEDKPVVSLDALKNEQDFDIPVSEEVSASEGANQVLYGALYEAIDSLTEKQRETVIRHYGLFGQPTEQLKDLDANPSTVRNRHMQAIRTLRQRLM